MRAKNIDLQYLCTAIGNLSGIPIRLYRGRELLLYYSVSPLPKDPICVYFDQIMAIKDRVGYFMTQHFNYYGVVTSGAMRVVLGPSRQTTANEQELRELAFRADVPKEQINEFVLGMKNIVSMPLGSIIQILLTLNHVLNGEKLSLADITVYDGDRERLKELLSREQKQYAFTKDTIDLINIKCHDLKHQLSVLKSLSEEDREKSLKDVEKAVMIYGNIAKTGNETLDIILTEKSFLCEKYGVRFTYMIEGEGLSFMEPADISSLFGNALDNAIESVMRETQAEKRVIKLNASKKRAYLSVHLENYCSEKVRFKDGLPVSGKADKLNHGFGAKSMRYIVEKYGGAMVMRQEGCLVVLDIILPMGESAGVTEGAAGGEGMPALT